MPLYLTIQLGHNFKLIKYFLHNKMKKHLIYYSKHTYKADSIHQFVKSSYKTVQKFAMR